MRDENYVTFMPVNQVAFEGLREAVEGARAAARRAPSPTTATATATASVADELQKLLQLKEAGALTQAEFDSQKSKLIGD
jgi:hypothetical protein